MNKTMDISVKVTKQQYDYLNKKSHEENKTVDLLLREMVRKYTRIPYGCIMVCHPCTGIRNCKYIKND